MLHFESDYLEGAHPLVLERLMQTNMEQTPGYGDLMCIVRRHVRKYGLRALLPRSGGTFYGRRNADQCYATLITAMLRPYEGVIAAESGHINQHEAGAVEAGGHKVLALPHAEGKLSATDVNRYVTDFLCQSQLDGYGSSRNGVYFPAYRVWDFVYIGRTSGFVGCVPQASPSFVYGWCAFGLCSCGSW